MSYDVHSFSVSADALHQATASGLAFAGQATEAPVASAPADGKAPATGGGDIQNLIAMGIMMMVAFYFMIILPQKRDKKERQKRLDGMKKGDKVISIGGIHGKVADVDHTQGIIAVEVAPKIVIKFSKAAIQAVTPKGEAAAEETAKPLDSDSGKTE